MSELHAWMMIPFGAFLTMIALAPLFFAGWWGRHYAKVSLAAAVGVLALYLFGLQAAGRVGAVLQDYVSFMALIGSLFVISGGIHIGVKGEATPLANSLFLLFGAAAANLFGTTGASMLLIRPWMRMNKYRITGHHVVFFIFIVSNVGGCLTPVGDPPLYLGYLKGIPFWWVTEQCWPVWAVGVGVLVVMFYIVDRRNFLRAPRPVREALTGTTERFTFQGGLNLALIGVILSVAFLERPPFLREVIMIGAAAGSYFTTPREIHEANRFTLGPIKEVAILFAGIFATMMPALDWLQSNASTLGTPSPALFYAGSGALSSVLDNAPTYLTFLSALFGSVVDHAGILQVQHLLAAGHASSAALAAGPQTEAVRGTLAALRRYFGAQLDAGTVSAENIRICWLLGQPALSRFILAISAGSVFFGANTYIGNGPNFMVKAIADHDHVHTPSFPGYIVKYTLPFMAPMLLVVWWIFFRT